MTILLYVADGIFGVLGAGVLLGSVQDKRIGLLLPAAAYGVSGVVSFALESWWPLFLGFSLARLFAVIQRPRLVDHGLRIWAGTIMRARGINVESLPAQRPSSVGILVNLGLHVWAGIVGSEIFLFSVEGIFLAALLAVVVQGLDTVAFYYTYTRLLADSPAARSLLPVKAAWLFAMKVLWYGFITLLTATVVRYLV